jgi:hypothetical protein
MCSMYSDLLRELDPELNELDLDKQVSTTFPTWFNTYVRIFSLKLEYLIYWVEFTIFCLM